MRLFNRLKRVLKAKRMIKEKWAEDREFKHVGGVDRMYLHAKFYRDQARHYVSAKDPQTAIACYEKSADLFRDAKFAYREMGMKVQEEWATANYHRAVDLIRKLKKVPESPYHKYGLNISGVVAIAGVFFGLFFLSFNLTGNAIAVNGTATNWIGVILFVIGLIGAFAYFRKGKKKK